MYTFQFIRTQKRFDESKVLTNLTICYYTGDDILKSHLMFNDRWWFDRYNLEGLKTYINDLTFGANIFLGKLDPYTGVFWRNQVYQYLYIHDFTTSLFFFF